MDTVAVGSGQHGNCGCGIIVLEKAYETDRTVPPEMVMTSLRWMGVP